MKNLTKGRRNKMAKQLMEMAADLVNAATEVKVNRSRSSIVEMMDSTLEQLRDLKCEIRDFKHGLVRSSISKDVRDLVMGAGKCEIYNHHVKNIQGMLDNDE